MDPLAKAPKGRNKKKEAPTGSEGPEGAAIVVPSAIKPSQPRREARALFRGPPAFGAFVPSGPKRRDSALAPALAQGGRKTNPTGLVTRLLDSRSAPQVGGPEGDEGAGPPSGAASGHKFFSCNDKWFFFI